MKSTKKIMKKNTVIMWILLLNFTTFFACGSDLETLLGLEKADLHGAKVISVKTSDAFLAKGTFLSAQFSEELATERLLKEEDFFVLVETSEVDDSFLQDVKSTPLSSSNKDDTIILALNVVDGKNIRIEVIGDLKSDTSYTLIVSEDVRDVSGNPLLGVTGEKNNVTFQFQSEKYAPIVVGTNVFGEIALNQKYLWFEFSEAVTNLTQDRLNIFDQDDNDLPIEMIQLSSDRKFARIVLNDIPQSCARMSPDNKYTLEFDENLENDQGLKTNKVQSFSWKSSSVCDDEEIVLENLKVSYIAAETDAEQQDYRFRVSFSSPKVLQSQLFYGKRGEEQKCLGGACPFVIGFSPENSGRFPSTYEISINAALALGQNYDLKLIVEDMRGQKLESLLSFELKKTDPIVLNEWLANPAGDDTVGEFIEIYNQGKKDAEPVELAGFQIQIDDNAICTFDDSAPSMEPGAFIIIATSAFDPFSYSDITLDKLYFPDCSTASLTLGNSVQSVSLMNSNSDPISVYSGYEFLNPGDNEGKSIERKSRFAPDEESSFVLSEPTPGSENESWLLIDE